GDAQAHRGAGGFHPGPVAQNTGRRRASPIRRTMPDYNWKPSPAGARAFTLRRMMPDKNWKPGGRDWNVYKKYTGNRKRR
ncbi:unnamed protein product, partial [Ectocarpus fasciculatus]